MGWITKLIGRIFSFLGGLVSGFKKSEYFLEMDESQDSKPEPKAVKQAPSAPAPVVAAPVAKAIETPVAPAPVVVASAPAPAASTAVKTFAPDFLLSLSGGNGRRRPGPSLDRFLDMAKQAKTS